jgi:hypothetical protein
MLVSLCHRMLWSMSAFDPMDHTAVGPGVCQDKRELHLSPIKQ